MPTNNWTAADLPDMTGRTAVVTGASSGIGEVTARELARVGARVVLAVRDIAKGQAAAATMTGDTEVRQLDLGSLASIREFGAAWSGDLDILVNNAGIMQVPEGRTVDGFELQFGTNHLGPFALTQLLLPHITDRVVTVTSNLHARGRIDLDDLDWRRRSYSPSQAYADSKLANVLFTFELQRRLSEASSGVRAMVVHPGVARTNLLGHVGGVQGALIRAFGRFVTRGPADGALPTLYAATQSIPGGSFVGPNGFAHMRGYPALQKASAAADDRDLAARLWERSAELTGTDAALTSASLTDDYARRGIPSLARAI
jgi:NAD(P)-dependent dehydrogenase (short-subunit alcohol dehydrogenase family)